MSYDKVTGSINIIRTCSIALGKVAVETAERFNTLSEAVDAVREIQGAVDALDLDECTVSGFIDYLQESQLLAETALAKAAAEIAADVLVPDPLPIGIVLEGGSGSGL